ncbi:MAG: DUF4038 domain-containing protein [Bacteroidota bacterium]
MQPFRHLLADTWWYGLTQRFDEAVLRRAAVQRAAEGFNAVQVVLGIPPEVGPLHPAATSPVGPAWAPDGTPNEDYLAWARRRIQHLNAAGLHVIVYGAWGHHIDWVGVGALTRWWLRVLETVDDLDVSYCLTGESNLWAGGGGRALWPDRSTTDVQIGAPSWRRLLSPWRAALRPLTRHRLAVQRRVAAWSAVLQAVAPRTQRAWLVHVRPGETGYTVTQHPEWLACNTVQTGHSRRAQEACWRVPLRLAQHGEPCLNLEPWYEGIHDDFYGDDQLYAFWAGRLAGTVGHVYGAHGLWNGGDGRFLSHWGTQTLAQALALETPRLLGASQRFLERHEVPAGEVMADVHRGRLRALGRVSKERALWFIPRVEHTAWRPPGCLFDPRQGAVVAQWPSAGPVVVGTSWVGRRRLHEAVRFE